MNFILLISLNVLFFGRTVYFAIKLLEVQTETNCLVSLLILLWAYNCNITYSLAIFSYIINSKDIFFQFSKIGQTYIFGTHWYAIFILKNLTKYLYKYITFEMLYVSGKYFLTRMVGHFFYHVKKFNREFLWNNI